MNVDVSPDGKRIVFDLLGDIYIMPIDGSGAVCVRRGSRAARRSTCSRGSAPTASASRSRATATACGTSGRWTLDGKNAKQISREQRWFVNSPAWSPDGSYIFARRHFVKERSLGAGEIWMFHAAGPTDGLQVTERNGWQKDAGEPGDLTGRPLPLLQQGRHAGADVRIQQGSQRDHLRDHAAAI